jgi:hypothetical protein
MLSGDAAGEADVRRCMLRVAARLSKPQLAQELVRMVGLQQRDLLRPAIANHPLKLLSLPGVTQAPVTADAGGEEAETSTGRGQQLECCKIPAASAVTPCTLSEAEVSVMAAGHQGAPSPDELSEAGFQLVKELMAHAGSCSRGEWEGGSGARGSAVWVRSWVGDLHSLLLAVPVHNHSSIPCCRLWPRVNVQVTCIYCPALLAGSPGRHYKSLCQRLSAASLSR